MVFCLNLRYLKVQISFTHTNFNHSVLISKENILASAKKTILSESESIAKLTDFLDENFIEATQNIYNSKGRLIVTGIGKVLLLLKTQHLTRLERHRYFFMPQRQYTGI
jgi:arabinose-5-phosphate isomerase